MNKGDWLRLLIEVVLPLVFGFLGGNRGAHGAVNKAIKNRSIEV